MNKKPGKDEKELIEILQNKNMVIKVGKKSSVANRSQREKGLHQWNAPKTHPE